MPPIIPLILILLAVGLILLGFVCFIGSCLRRAAPKQPTSWLDRTTPRERLTIATALLIIDEYGEGDHVLTDDEWRTVGYAIAIREEHDG